MPSFQTNFIAYNNFINSIQKTLMHSQQLSFDIIYKNEEA